MAKVGFWLRGARGKMGGAVLSKSENGTIARENVTPKNPRTSKQMYQRAIFATVASAARAMKQLIDHAFYGIADGNKCIQEFRRINLNKLRNKVASDIEQSLQSDENIAMLAPKGYKFIVPNEYQISSGVLSAPLITFAQNNTNGSFKFPDVSITTLKTTKDYVAEMFGVNPGEQLTFAAIAVSPDSTQLMYQSPQSLVEGSYGHACYANSFEVYRLVFNPLTAETESDWDAGLETTATTEDFFSKIQDVLNMEESSTFLLDLIKSQTTITDSVVKSDPDALDNDEYKAGAFIRSKYENGQWNYSTAIMVTVVPSREHDYGVPPAEAVASYTDGVSVGTSNDPFLDEGGEGGSL